MIFFLEDRNLWPEGAMFNNVAEVIFGPLEWLYEVSDLYDSYITWLDR